MSKWLFIRSYLVIVLFILLVGLGLDRIMSYYASKDNITIEKQFPYVSRAGLKLEKAFKEFYINPENQICLDIGASTGGFTDCLLKYGAKKVYAVDVGIKQLHNSLRNNSKVISLENTNARYLTNEIIPEKIDILVCDVSFISVLKIIPFIKDLLKEDFQGVVLIKPQFELSREKLKKGIVRKKEYHIQAVEKVVNSLKNSGYKIAGLTFSEPFGTDGNIEFLAYINFNKNTINTDKIKEVVEKAHKKFEEKYGSS